MHGAVHTTGQTGGESLAVVGASLGNRGSHLFHRFEASRTPRLALHVFVDEIGEVASRGDVHVVRLGDNHGEIERLQRWSGAPLCDGLHRSSCQSLDVADATPIRGGTNDRLYERWVLRRPVMTDRVI